MSRRRFMNKMITYEISVHNQGSPDVYVDGIWVGKVVNGKCTWKGIACNHKRTVTLKNVVLASPIVSEGTNIVPFASINVGNITDYYVEPGSSTIKGNGASMWFLSKRGTIKTTTTFSVFDTANLLAGATSLMMDAKQSISKEYTPKLGDPSETVNKSLWNGTCRTNGEYPEFSGTGSIEFTTYNGYRYILTVTN